MLKHSLQPYHASEKVCAIVVDRVRLGVFDVGVCIVKPVLIKKRSCQGEMNPKQEIGPAKRRRYSEGYPETVNSRLCITLGTVYNAKDEVTSADGEPFTFLREEIDCAGCNFLYGIELVVIMKQQSEPEQTPCLSRCVMEPFGNFQRFFHLPYPFLVEAHRKTHVG